MSEPKWISILHHRPDHNREIWVWDNEKREKFFVRYFGDEQSWKDFRNNPRFPLWAYVWEIE